MYQTECKYTYDEFMKYEKSVAQKKMLIMLVASSMILLTIYAVLIRSIIAVLVMAGIMVLMDSILLLLNNKRIKKLWNSSTSMQNKDVKYTFNDSNMEIENELGNSKIEYNSIYKIIETKTNFYIMISTVQGFIIVKENCSSELINFIKSLQINKK